MLPTYSINDGLSAAVVLAEKLPAGLSRTAVRLYTAICGAAIDTARSKGYSANTTHVTMHLPLEVLANVCGIHRVTAWRHLPALRELGLIDYRSHYGTLRGETRITGTLFQVRLNPSAGSKARLSYDDLKHKWRDLDRDVKRKRTAYRQLRDNVQPSVEASRDGLDIQRLLVWTLPPKPKQSPMKVLPDSCAAPQSGLELLLDVRNSPREQRGRMVDLGAQALSQALSDHSGVNFYRKLLWQLLKRFEATGEDYSYQVYLMAQRAAVDVVDGFARRGGALFTARLKLAKFYEPIQT